jgi:BASS family bile acid:Na+ symporter
MAELVKLIPVVLQASIIILVFGLGLRATLENATYVLRRPGLLLRAFLALAIVVPVFAALLAALFNLHEAVKHALVLIAVSPVPPFLPVRQMKSGGSANFVFGLLVAASLVAIVYVPVAVHVLGAVFQHEVRLPLGLVARVVLITVLVPLGAGLGLRIVAPRLADRIAPWASVAGNTLMVAGVVPILIAVGPDMLSLIGNGSIAAFAVLIAVGLIAGHRLGGPAPGDRAALALASATRHPGVALAVANANFPGEKLVLAAILLFFLVNIAITVIYLKWWKRRSTQTAGYAMPGTSP